jgi:HPt (histidine-containing phosphotransfer) domain-containing protein
MRVIDKQLFDDTFQYFDNEIVVEIIDIFLNEYHERLNTLKECIESRDFNKLKFHAHSMKGVVSNFAAPTVQAAAKTLEDKGTNEEDENLTDDLLTVTELVNLLSEDLKEVRADFC